MVTYRSVLGSGLSLRQLAMLDLALSFFTWRTLVLAGKLPEPDAVAAMVAAIDGT